MVSTAYDGATKFGEYAQKWVENAQIAPKTRLEYNGLLKRILPALEHIKLEKLQAHHLEAFYKNLAESGVKVPGRCAVSVRLREVMQKQKISGAELSRKSGLSECTTNTARRSEPVSIPTAERIAAALSLPAEELFAIRKETSGLSDTSIMHHHRLIANVLEKAKKEGLIPFNVAKEHATAPKPKHKEAKYLDDEQAQSFLALLLKEPDIREKTTFILLLFTGIRRGELCGLSWPDIDDKKNFIHIKRASRYLPGKGIIEVPTKTISSVRTIKTSQFVFDTLTEYRLWWNKRRLVYGKDWRGDKNRLFIQEDSSPIFPDTVNQWLKGFLKKHEFTHITPHSLRHTFATLQITSGVDVRTLQARTRHAQATTLVNIYSHAIMSAQEAASDALEKVLLPNAK